MRTFTTINGSNVASSQASSSNNQRSSFTAPGSRKDNTGDSPLAFTGISLWVGASASASLVPVINDVSGESFTIPISETPSTETDFIDIYSPVYDLDSSRSVSFGHNPTGTVIFGIRNLGGVTISPLPAGFDKSYVGRLRYHEVPTAPQNVTVYNPTDSEMTVSWDKPLEDGGNQIKKYVVQYSKNEFGRTAGSPLSPLEEFTEVTTASMSVVLQGLDSDTYYWIRVLAANDLYDDENIKGGSPWSHPLRFKTTPPVPNWEDQEFGEYFTDTSGGETNGQIILDTPKPVVGSTFSGSVRANYANYYDVIDGTLPSGLVLDPFTGTLAGIPDTEGIYSFTVAAVNELGSARKTFTVVVTEFAEDNPTVDPLIRVGLYYSANVAIENGSAYAITSGTLPSGLSLDSVNGRIYGTPQFAGQVGVTLTITKPTDPVTYVVKDLSFDVKPNATIFRDIGGVIAQTTAIQAKRWDGSNWIDIDNVKKFDGTSFVDVSYPTQPLQATGGTIVDYADASRRYRSHIFTEDDNFEILSLGESDATVSFLLVGGGGSGGAGSSVGVFSGGGGGGGGGVLYGSTTVSVGNYSISVGEGGLASSSTGNDGENSSAFGTSVTGGGGGGSQKDTAAGRSGGAGGGGANNGLGGSGTGSGDLIQGYSGGRSSSYVSGSTYYPPGGGGGSGAFGEDSSSGNSGNGGDGRAYNLSGTYTYYGAGGGGGANGDDPISNVNGSGGTGGGADGGVDSDTGSTAPSAPANYGGGGGGGRGNDSNSQGGAGGKGLVIVRYPIGFNDFTPLSASGGTVVEIDYEGVSYKLHTFSSGGSDDFVVSGLSDDPNADIIEYLIVAGGGGGGAGDNETEAGSGGGAGGVLSGTLQATVDSYVVQVGSGGTGNGGSGNCAPGNAGGDSSLGVVVADGGGGGGPARATNGRDGGSGGGAGRRASRGGLGVLGQGNNGSKEGGNSGGAGGSSDNPIPANGVRIASAGRTSSITGSTTEYGRGGTGGANRTYGPVAVTDGGGGGGGNSGGEGPGNPRQFMPPGRPGNPGKVFVRYKI